MHGVGLAARFLAGIGGGRSIDIGSEKAFNEVGEGGGKMPLREDMRAYYK